MRVGYPQAGLVRIWDRHDGSGSARSNAVGSTSIYQGHMKAGVFLTRPPYHKIETERASGGYSLGTSATSKASPRPVASIA